MADWQTLILMMLRTRVLDDEKDIAGGGEQGRAGEGGGVGRVLTQAVLAARM